MGSPKLNKSGDDDYAHFSGDLSSLYAGTCYDQPTSVYEDTTGGAKIWKMEWLVTLFEFYQDLRQQKTTIHELSCGVVCMLMFNRCHRTPTCDRQEDRQTDGHSAIAYTALAERRAVKKVGGECDKLATVGLRREHFSNDPRAVAKFRVSDKVSETKHRLVQAVAY